MTARTQSRRSVKAGPAAGGNDEWWTHDLAVHAEPLAGPALADREWLLTNGTGAFAMGTAAAVNTRRYHGLLIAATHPPVGRIVALSQLFERLALRPAADTVDAVPGAGEGSGGDARGGDSSGGDSSGGGQIVEFTTCQFRDAGGRDVFSPRGFSRQVAFRRGLAIEWRYRAAGIDLIRTLRLHWKQQAITVGYSIRGLEAAGLAGTLFLSPMMTLRDFHGTTRRQWTPPYIVRSADDTATITQGKVSITLRCAGARFVRSDEWWYDIFYPREEQRGADPREDYFLPGWFELPLGDGEPFEVLLTAALGEQPVSPHPASPRLGPAEPAAEQETDPRRAHLEPMLAHLSDLPQGRRPLARPAHRRQLAIAADDFVVDRTIAGQKLSTIIAGYPWFADWGRDTFIALPGLLLETGRYSEARDTLQTFARALRNGLVPNRFDDYDDSAAHYNTVDASLWFIHAAMRYVQVSGDRESWNDWLAAACDRIITAYSEGTENGIHACEDGLITAGSPGTQLTWMDAKVNEVIFTPRYGKAVEINALWYHALCGLGTLAGDSAPSTADRYRRMARQVAESFVPCFWNEHLGHLNDTVFPDGHGHWQPDGTLRPNQVFAAALPHSPLPDELRSRVVAVVRDRLLTPCGLRTLPVDDHRYHGRYLGDAFHRDKAYHQGTVWPWLIGPYAEAVLRSSGFSRAARAEAFAAIRPLLGFMQDRGLGQLHEIHEGDAPHHPAGCPAQAWSVAEVLRVLRLIERGG